MEKREALFAGTLVFGLALVAGAAPDTVPSSSETYKNQPHAHELKFKRRADKGQILKPGEKAPTTTLEKSQKEMETPSVVPSSAPASVPPPAAQPAVPKS
jgi:hypothetical protein